jgi:hypothetical protein
MQRLNRRYQSFPAYLRLKIWGTNASRDTLASQLWEKDYSYLHDTEPFGPDSGLFIGSLQPLADIVKDVVDTVKPYKGTYQIKRDAMQPLYGLMNMGAALLTLIGAPIAFLVNIVRYSFYPDTFKENMQLNVVRTLSWLIDSVTTAVRGVTQLVATPLTWLLKMPLRGIITMMTDKSNIEDTNSIQKLVIRGEEIASSDDPEGGYHMDVVLKAIHIKYIRGVSRNQPTGIDPHVEQNLFHDLPTDRHFKNRDQLGTRGYYNDSLTRRYEYKALHYLQLFKPEATENDTNSERKHVTDDDVSRHVFKSGKN